LPFPIANPRNRLAVVISEIFVTAGGMRTELAVGLTLKGACPDGLFSGCRCGRHEFTDVLEDEMEGAIFVLNCTIGVNAIEDRAVSIGDIEYERSILSSTRGTTLVIVSDELATITFISWFAGPALSSTTIPHTALQLRLAPRAGLLISSCRSTFRTGAL
jgi:hypothetical protein